MSAVDPTAGTITVSTSALGANKSVVVHVSKNTVLRRYAPGSVKFDDATAAPIDQIKAGDQLRARGQRSADGGELTADEVVSGSFRNISGTIDSIDAGSENDHRVEDLATKKPVVVKIADTSQLRKLPAPMAQRIAARLKGGSGDVAGGEGPNGGAPGGGASFEKHGRSGGWILSARAKKQRYGGCTRGCGWWKVGAARWRRGGAGGQGGDLQQAITRMPASNLTDLQKGDAVMIVATEVPQQIARARRAALSRSRCCRASNRFLQASPSGQSILTPWTMSGAPGGDAAQ